MRKYNINLYDFVSLKTDNFKAKQVKRKKYKKRKHIEIQFNKKWV